MARKQFYLIARKDKLTRDEVTGKLKPTFYCRFRTDDGDLLSWRSTGETLRARATNWAIRELKSGALLPKESLTFGKFAEGWWTTDCAYSKRRAARGKPVSPGYADVQSSYLSRHILPHFKDKKLSRITGRTVEAWILDMRNKALSPTTVNHCLTTLKTMLKEAARLGYIPSNPAAFVEQLQETPKEKQILSLDEVKELFKDEALATAWNGSLRHFALNMLAASTGIRMGEGQGLQVQHVHPEYVVIVHSWARKHGMKEPKWGSAREIPIPSRTSRYLAELKQSSPYQGPEDLVFWGKDGRTPLRHREILEGFYNALDKIGVTPEERARRNVTFHSWRHLFNTLCRSRIPDYKLQRLTGHRTQEMTEHYTHISLEDLKDVLKLQEEVLA